MRLETTGVDDDIPEPVIDQEGDVTVPSAGGSSKKKLLLPTRRRVRSCATICQTSD